MESKIKYILFDAANTLIHKPALWEKIDEALRSNNFLINRQQLKIKHKIISEIINFPDRTDESFYKVFNSEFLLACGIIPTKKLLNDLFKTCTYLPWEKFSDAINIDSYKLPIGVLSNFNSSLPDTLKQLFPFKFNDIIISEKSIARKPDLHFYKIALQQLNLEPQEILYIGDSLKLDVMPARELGMQAFLLDRDNIYPDCIYRLQNLNDLSNLLNQCP